MSDDAKNAQKDIDDAIAKIERMIRNPSNGDSVESMSLEEKYSGKIDTSKLDSLSKDIKAQADEFRAAVNETGEKIEKTRIRIEKLNERSDKFGLLVILALGVFVIVYAIIKTQL